MSYIYEPCLKALHESGCNSSTAVLCRGLLLNDKTINYTTIATSTNESFHVNINGSLTIVYNGTNNRSIPSSMLAINIQQQKSNTSVIVAIATGSPNIPLDIKSDFLVCVWNWYVFLKDHRLNSILYIQVPRRVSVIWFVS
jgi:hypothetical protein